LIAFFLGILAHYIDPSLFPKVESENWSWINSIPFVSIATYVGYFITCMFILIGGMLVISSIVGEFEFPRRKKFLLPNKFATTSYGFRAFEERMLIVEEETANKANAADAKSRAAD
jgi:hypothetical protein